MSAWQVYLISRMDAFKTLLLIAFASAIIVSIIYAIIVVGEDTIDFEGKAKKLAKYLSITLAIILVLESVLPSSRTLALMYIIPKITQNQEVKKLPPLLLKYLEHELKQK